MSRAFDPHVVYLYSATDGTPIYAGCTANLKQRMVQHKKKSAWWTPRLQVTHTTYPCQESAFDAEAVLINDLRPVGNRYIPADPRRRVSAVEDDLLARLFPIEDAAALLEVAPEDIPELVKRGHLHCVDLRLDGEPTLRITGSSLADYDALLEAA